MPVVGPKGLIEILQCWIMEEFVSVFNANDTFPKVQKSKLIQKRNLVLVDPKVYVAIVDMGMIWWMSTPAREGQEKADPMVYTCAHFVTKIINLVIYRH